MIAATTGEMLKMLFMHRRDNKMEGCWGQKESKGSKYLASLLRMSVRPRRMEVHPRDRREDGSLNRSSNVRKAPIPETNQRG